MMRLILIALLAITTLPAAHAAEEEPKSIEDVVEQTIEVKKPEDTTSRYAPDFCDFEITFPEEPYTAKRCPQGAKQCYNTTNYSMVYNTTTTVDVTVTCIPSKPENYSRYNDRVIRSALSGMVQRAEINQYDINTEEQEDIRHGTITGSNQLGKENKLYNAQLWVGQNSVMTVEAKMIGRNNHEARATYSDIIKSINRKQNVADVEPSAGEETQEESPAEEETQAIEIKPEVKAQIKEQTEFKPRSTLSHVQPLRKIRSDD